MTENNNDQDGKMPPVKENHIMVQFADKDLNQLVKLLGTSKDVFVKIALNALDQGDQGMVEKFKARAELAEIYAEILAGHSKIGEPKSRDIH